MRTLNIDGLRREREQLTKRLETIDQLLGLVDALDGSAPKKAGRPKGRGHMSAAGRTAIVKAQKERWKRFKAQQKGS